VPEDRHPAAGDPSPGLLDRGPPPTPGQRVAREPAVATDARHDGRERHAGCPRRRARVRGALECGDERGAPQDPLIAPVGLAPPPERRDRCPAAAAADEAAAVEFRAPALGTPAATNIR
jgi:hypothetical protein